MRLFRKKSDFVYIAAFVCSIFTSVLMTVISKYFIVNFNSNTINLLTSRFICFGLICIPLYLKNNFSFLRSKFFYLNFIRDSISIIAIMIWYSNSILIPINNAVSISFLTPLFVVFLWSVISGVLPSIFFLISLIIGFLGIFIITGFELQNINYSYIFIILVTIIRACVNILSKKISEKQTITDAICSNAFVSFIFAIFLILIKNNMGNPLSISTADIFFGFITASLNIVYFGLFLFAVRIKNLNALQPFDFLRIIFSVILSFFILNEKIEMNFFIGLSLILTSLFILKKYNKS